VNAIPLGYLTSEGERAARIAPLTWYTLIVSIAVCIAIGIMLWRGVRRARLSGGDAETRAVPVQRGSKGSHWISIGVAVSMVPLLVSVVWTMITLAAVAGPPKDTGLVLDVTGHQWWWEVQYYSDDPSESFTTANEIHIPVGQRVLVRLHGGDVIHSFWVPKLTGKTDAIPGQVNFTWMQAGHPGRYRGQCGEFCGPQHAYMGFEVVADNKDDFEAWRAAQLRPAPAPITPAQARGQAIVQYRCGLCHRVRGTDAAAVVAPDLTHLMTRRTIASTRLVNNPGNLIGWIQDPQGLKPGCLMPNQYLSSQQLADVQAYLVLLR
jgi:cytochrome c oxidase subunit 2